MAHVGFLTVTLAATRFPWPLDTPVKLQTRTIRPRLDLAMATKRADGAAVVPAMGMISADRPMAFATKGR